MKQILFKLKKLMAQLEMLPITTEDQKEIEEIKTRLDELLQRCK